MKAADFIASAISERLMKHEERSFRSITSKYLLQSINSEMLENMRREVWVYLNEVAQESGFPTPSVEVLNENGEIKVVLGEPLCPEMEAMFRMGAL